VTVVIAAFTVSLVALVLSGLSALYTRKQAQAATRADLRARRPALEVTLHASVSSGETTAMFYVENKGAEDLDSVVVFRPMTSDGVHYAVARLGQEFGDEADLGRLEIRAKQGLVLSIGSADDLPEFRVRVRSRIGNDTWEDAYVLDDPRFHLNVF
jgi:hypothetical protein